MRGTVNCTTLKVQFIPTLLAVIRKTRDFRAEVFGLWIQNTFAITLLTLGIDNEIRFDFVQFGFSIKDDLD